MCLTTFYLFSVANVKLSNTTDSVFPAKRGRPKHTLSIFSTLYF